MVQQMNRWILMKILLIVRFAHILIRPVTKIVKYVTLHFMVDDSI